MFRFGVAGHLGDDELLSQFVGREYEGDSAEAAFAVLVERHGPMVLGVCRRVLRDRHEAEDAFQATFLVLARKAASIARRDQLANWLYGVACRTALDLRARASRRKTGEHHAQELSPREVRPSVEADLDELRAILDEEVARLPDRYRGVLVLCELEGLSRQAAAKRLGIPEGTLSSRLARAKGLLRHRLTRRGLAPSVVVLTAALAPETQAILIPSSLASSTIQAAAHIVAGISLAEATSTSVATLTQGVLKTMLIAKFKGLVMGLTVATIVTTGIGVLAQPPGPGEGDRLSSLERKLDRILEALGGSRGQDPFHSTAATWWNDANRLDASANRQAPRITQAYPAMPPANGHRSANRSTPVAAGPDERPTTTGSAEAQVASQPPPSPTDRGAGWDVDVAAHLAQSRSETALPDGRSNPLGARVDALERRLSEMERRLNEMDRRLAQSAPSQSRTGFHPGEVGFEATPDRTVPSRSQPAPQPPAASPSRSDTVVPNPGRS